MESEKRQGRIDAAGQWRSRLTVVTGALVLFLALSGLAIYLLPFSLFSQASVLTHTLLGLAGLAPILAYLWYHWRLRRGGNLSHFQLLGYFGAVILLVCLASGVVVTWQGLFEPAMTAGWELTHLLTGLALPVLVTVHLATVIGRRVNNPESRQRLRASRRVFWVGSSLAAVVLLGLTGLWSAAYQDPAMERPFPDDYNWTFGEDRPFAPSLARIGNGDSPGAPGRVKREILALLDESERQDYLAALERVESELAGNRHYGGHDAGLFAMHRQALDSLDFMSKSRVKAVEAVLADTAESIRKRGALPPEALAGSERCGRCHEQIYEEWLPSAHRYSSMDMLFQTIQEFMAEETSPAHTRYCAGCHDPISLFSGAKNEGNITLSAEGSHEGISCIGCHAITRADVQGNADYTITPPRRYMYELNDGVLGRWLGDFLIRTYPEKHVESYARPLYRTAEFCGACHKQYMDSDINTDIGRVQGQNQYDSWARSRWHVEGSPRETVNCRECHMPLVESTDPASGDTHDYYRSRDDGMHRSHRFLGSNQIVPLLHELEGAEEHVRLTEQWLRGEIDIPEIAHKWPEGPVIRMRIDAPEQAQSGEPTRFRVVLTNNKAGHDFPTGPMDVIESWLEVKVTDDAGRVLHHSGGLDERGAVVEPSVWFKADAFDREGNPIDRHNLWDLVGKSYSRSLYPGVTDREMIELQCPSSALRSESPARNENTERTRLIGEEPGRHISEFTLDPARDHPDRTGEQLTVEAVLWYRKANPDFLDALYGAEAEMRVPVTEMNRAQTTIAVVDEGDSGIE